MLIRPLGREPSPDGRDAATVAAVADIPDDVSFDWESLDRPHDVGWLESSVLETWDFDDPELSRLRFLALIDSVPPGSATALVYRTQVARAHSLRREFDEANEVLDAAALRCDDLADGCACHHVRARLAIERGRTLNSSGAPDKAMAFFQEAYELAAAAGAAGLAIDALHMCAIAAGSVDGPAASTAWNERAIAEAEASDDPAARRWLGSLLNNDGWDKHDAGSHEEALEIFERALAAREEAGKEPELTIARWTVARALRSLGRLDEALRIQDALAESPAGRVDGFVHEERGECLLALDRADEAQPAFARAYELLSADRWLAESEPDRLARLARLAGHPD
jgi:tetratricopeptide (TPR) repeat protein